MAADSLPRVPGLQPIPADGLVAAYKGLPTHLGKSPRFASRHYSLTRQVYLSARRTSILSRFLLRRHPLRIGPPPGTAYLLRRTSSIDTLSQDYTRT